MKRLTIGMLAHVDSGKTTLSEALLYLSGTLRKLGRVDHGDAFLDTDRQERERGITIFSKQARLSWGWRNMWNSSFSMALSNSPMISFSLMMRWNSASL